MALTSSSAAVVAANFGGTDPEYDAQYPLAFTSDGSFILAGTGALDAIIFPPGHDCAFIADLTNAAP